MSRDKGEAPAVTPCARVSADWFVNTSATSDAGESAGVSSGPSVFKVHEADASGRRNAVCRRFSSTRPCRRTLIVSVSAPSTATSWRSCGACCHAGDEQLLCPVVRPLRRAAAVNSAAAVCYKRIAVDRAGIRCTLCCCFRTAPTTVTWSSRGWQGEVGQRILGLLLATDAARLPGLNVVLSGDRLFQQYVVDACVKIEQQRLNYLLFNQNSLRSWRCSGEWRRLRRSSSAHFYAYRYTYSL